MLRCGERSFLLGAASPVWRWFALAGQCRRLPKILDPFFRAYAPRRQSTQSSGGTGAAPARRPADFGGNGAWFPGFNGNLAETTWKGVKSADKHVDVPFLPWTLKTYNERVENLSKDDPEASACRSAYRALCSTRIRFRSFKRAIRWCSSSRETTIVADRQPRPKRSSSQESEADLAGRRRWSL